ncbi:MAG: hypothetical protein Edafosvirus10_40 [Edafosvirus sp.]|uniref:C-CAP/cofactor C-like domain-containing protein n=1 Tax=Edafosvirus sp. TaxID=2487765 RepID=A0A3G4ZTY9_9VIRU|nr:MAG: hypothetical protein Edafosvirus10_40 [Edafosvirus sp.]
MVNKNIITFTDLNELEQDFKNYLDHKVTIKYENCKNMKIKFGSKINKLMIINCENMEISLDGLVNGLRIKKAQSINIVNLKNMPIGSVQIEKSRDVNVRLARLTYDKKDIEIDDSKNVKIIDV